MWRCMFVIWIVVKAQQNKNDRARSPSGPNIKCPGQEHRLWRSSLFLNFYLERRQNLGTNIFDQHYARRIRKLLAGNAWPTLAGAPVGKEFLRLSVS